MATYHLFDAVKATQTGPINGYVQPTGAQGESPLSPTAQQQFSVLLNGTGSCSVNVVLVGSNDSANWQQVGTIAVTAASADVTPGQGALTTNQSWRYYAAYCNPISGTNASAQCLLNC